MRFNPLRGAIGAIPGFTPANAAFFALFNNSTGAHYIRVWEIQGNFIGNPAVRWYLLNGRLTTQNAGVVSPMVAGEATPVGALDTDDLATTPAPLLIFNLSSGPAFNQGNDYPIVVLRPGWSFVGYQAASGASVDVGFRWEWLYAEELFRLSAGDSADGD